MIGSETKEIICHIHETSNESGFRERLDRLRQMIREGDSKEGDAISDFNDEGGIPEDEGHKLEASCHSGGMIGRMTGMFREKGLICRIGPGTFSRYSFDLGQVDKEKVHSFTLKIRIEKPVEFPVKVFAGPDGKEWFFIGSIMGCKRPCTFFYEMNPQIAGKWIFIKMHGDLPEGSIRWLKLFKSS
jgi:hypothetical protein